MRTRHLLLIRLLLGALLLAAAPASRLEAADLKPAKKRLRDSIAGWTPVPKVHVGVKGVFEVYADGRLHTDLEL